MECGDRREAFQAGGVVRAGGLGLSGLEFRVRGSSLEEEELSVLG